MLEYLGANTSYMTEIHTNIHIFLRKIHTLSEVSVQLVVHRKRVLTVLSAMKNTRVELAEAVIAYLRGYINENVLLLQLT